MNQNDVVYIAGHTGLAGSAILRALAKEGYTNLIYRTHKELDLTHQQQVNAFFAKEKPAYVFIAAAKVGGILANHTYPAEFIYQNIAIATHIIDAAYRYGVKRLLFLGSACSYPRDCPQPMQEDYLLTGPLEPTNEPYAIAKIAGIKMCEAYNKQYGTDFLAVIPTNLYGPNDTLDLTHSHVLPALMQKIHDAKLAKDSHITLWGTGQPKREFLYVDDMASACLFLMKKHGFNQMINISSQQEVSIREAAELLCEMIGFTGTILYDTSKPDGTPR